MSSNFSGTVITVGTGKDYTTISAAVTAAQNGDVVLIDPGDYNELVTLDKQVHLVGNTDDLDTSTVRIYGVADTDRTGVVTLDLAAIPVDAIGDPSIYIENLFIENTDADSGGLFYESAIGTGSTEPGSTLNVYINKCKLAIIDNGSWTFCLLGFDGINLNVYVNYCELDSDTEYNLGYSQDFNAFEFNNCVFNKAYSSYGSDSPTVNDYVTTPTTDYGYTYGSNYYADYYIQGTVKQGGVAVERTVRLHRRDNGRLVESQTSGVDGTFSFGLPNNTDEFYVIAFDDDTGDNYNALIYDKIVAA